MVWSPAPTVHPLRLVTEQEREAIYHLGVARGAWIEYALVGDEVDLLPGVQARGGDHLGVEVVGLEQATWGLDAGATSVERAHYDVYVNDRLVLTDARLRLGPVELVYPTGLRFWRAWRAQHLARRHRRADQRPSPTPEALIVGDELATLAFIQGPSGDATSMLPRWATQVVRAQVELESGVLVQAQCLQPSGGGTQLVLVESNLRLMRGAWAS
jgi:hypothetical protein